MLLLYIGLLALLTILGHVLLWTLKRKTRHSSRLRIPVSTKNTPRHKTREKAGSREKKVKRTGPHTFTIQEAERKSRGKKQGGNGGARERPKTWDREKEARPEQCYHCGADIPTAKSPKKTQERFVIDLEKRERGLVKTITRWEVAWVTCPECGKLVSGRERVNALKNYMFGYGVIAYVLHHRFRLKFPIPKIVEELQFIMGEHAPTEQAVRDWINATAEENEGLFWKLLRLVKGEEYLEIDESGMPMDGEHWWMWVLVAKDIVTLYKASNTRGHEAIEDEIADYDGVIVSDFWSAYQKFPNPKQKCLVHLYKEVTDLLVKEVKAQERKREKLERSREDRKRKARSPSQRGRGRPKEFKILPPEEEAKIEQEIEEHGVVAAALYQLAAFLRGVMAGMFTAEEAETRLHTLLDTHERAGELSHDFEKIRKRMRTHLEELFRFLRDEEVDVCSTNRAEGEVKKFAGLRSSTLCWRSGDTARSDSQILSYMETWERAGLDPWRLSLLLAKRKWQIAFQRIRQSLDKPPPAGGACEFSLGRALPFC